MEELRLPKKAQALVVVAHPDDETIWMGGTIARRKDMEWTIFVLCRKSDEDRAPKFRKAVKYYGARGIICDLEDTGSTQESDPTEIKKTIREKLPKKTFDAIFTHGANGEYGHPRHKGVHRAVKQMIKNRELKTRKTFFFAYRMDEKKKMAVPRENASYVVELSNKEWKDKRSVVRQLYGFGHRIFETRSCAKKETFTTA